MKKLLIVILLCAVTLSANANDGVFYAEGNHLIPICETDISVKKEVLTLKRVGQIIEVTVYYEFFNPTVEKSLLVGFEAAPPYPMEENYYEHPNISGFSVEMNGSALSFKVSLVDYFNPDNNKERRPYVSNGHVMPMTMAKAKEAFANDADWAPVYYVYHFNATFKKGLNIIRHTYRYVASSSVMTSYECPYVLTAANRWANHQIDDFTLIVDMGERQSFLVNPTFFKSSKEWQLLGVGCVDSIDFAGMGMSPLFHMREGGIMFKASNFHPDGELFVANPNVGITTMMYYNENAEGFLEEMKSLYYEPYIYYDEEKKTYDDYYMGLIQYTFSDFQKKIIKNLPFAQRGYVFKNRDIQRFYESTKWYIPKPDYKGEMSEFTKDEKRWIEYWSK